MRILTGLQPTNILHIGNLFGALLPAIKLQKDHEVIMMLADYHAITTNHDPKTLHENTLLLAATMIAVGVDLEKTILFKQSDVSAHTELGWILQTQTRFGEASRMTQFKDKAGDNKERISVGLFTYPTLMAADILLYNSDAVPVGADQKQHLELTRNLAERINKKYSTNITVPEPFIQKSGAKISSLTEPKKKMSKSAPSAKSYISLMDEPNIIRKKIKSAVTDSEAGITLSDNRPGLKNLLTLHSLVKNSSLEEVLNEYQGKGMREVKEDLAEAIVSYLEPIQLEIKRLMDNKDELEKILQENAKKAEALANPNLQKIKVSIGI